MQALENKFWKQLMNEFAETHFWQLHTPFVPSILPRLAGITYKQKFETLLKTISENWKKNSKTRLLLQIHLLLIMDILGNKRHLINNRTKKQIGLHLNSKPFSSSKLLGSVSNGCRTW